MRRKSVVLFCFESRVFICLGESLHRQLSRSAGQRTRTHTKCGTLVLFCCDATTQPALQLHQERTQVCTVSGNSLILTVRLTKSLVRTVYQDYSLTSVRSQSDLKVPQQFFEVPNCPNILIGMENLKISLFLVFG